MDSSPTPAPRTNGKGKKVNIMDFFTEPPHLVERRRKAALQTVPTTPNNATRPQAQQWGKTGVSQAQIIMPSAPGKDTQMAAGNQEDDKTDVADDATDVGDLKDFEEVEAEAQAAGLSSEVTTNFRTPVHQTSQGQGQRRNGLVRQDAITPESAYQEFSSPSTSGPFSKAPLPSLFERLAATPTTPDPTAPTPAMVDDFIASALNMHTSHLVSQQHHDARPPAGQAASNLQIQNGVATQPKLERMTPEMVGGTADATSAMQVQETPSMQERARSSAFSAGSGFNSTARSTFGGASSAQTRSAWGTGNNQQPQTTSTTSFAQTLENDLAQFGFGAKITQARATDQEGNLQLQFQPEAPSSTQPKGLQQQQATESTPQPNMTAAAPQNTFSFNSAFSFSTTSGFSVNPAPSTSAVTTWNPKTQNSVAFDGAPSKPAATIYAPSTQNHVAFGAVPSTSTAAIGNPNNQIDFATQQVWAPPPPKVLTDVERCNLWWAEMSRRVAFDEEQKRAREAKAREEAAKMKVPMKTPPFAVVTGPEEKGKVEEVKGVRVRPEEIIPGNAASEFYKKILEHEEAFDKRRNAGGSLLLTETGKPETKADGWRRYNAIMDKKEEERKKRRFEEAFNGTRKRRYYLAGDDDLENIAASHHTLSPRVAYHQLYPADDVAVPPLPVPHPPNASFPVPAVEEQGDGWVNPEWVNEGKAKERKVIGLGRSLKALASGVFTTVKGKLKAIWGRGQAMKKAQATTPHFKVTEQELAELGVNFEDYQKMARQVFEEMGFQVPQEPVVNPFDDDDEEDGDYIDDGDSESTESIFTGSVSDDL
ncbi:hypothetical protein H1R20_g11682, partial [Candolleomyces eurysporus]